MTKTVSGALKAAFAAETATIATLWRVTLLADSPPTVLGFTDHDEDIEFDGVTFQAGGFNRTDIASADDISVDNLELDGILSSPLITEDDLRKGVWDDAAVRVSQVNWSDLSQGEIVLRTGNLGEVSLKRGAFVAELSGLTKKYTRTFGELTQPSCRAELGDARCKVVMGPFTVDGTLEAVGSDGLTFYDSARTEDGPTGGANITNITHANPGVVTVDDASDLFNGMPITMSGIVGPDELNTTTIVRNLSGNSFEIIDTTGLDAYVSGGTVTPLGMESGYFDYGVMTMTSGAAEGYSMEVKSFVPGQWKLQMKMAGGLLTPQAGDTYRMKAGCDKSLGTCKNKFSNVANMRAEPYLSGIDKLVQIGKQK